MGSGSVQTRGAPRVNGAAEVAPSLWRALDREGIMSVMCVLNADNFKKERKLTREHFFLTKKNPTSTCVTC